ncbi:zinc finger protein 260-like [Ptychodera flava]|uniref:zinc finger protein 260-like n=1 Tax=Ptychodera flava TaxID=63121 RepID=UPI00396A0655
MAMESLKVDGLNISLELLDAEDIVRTKPVFLPSRGGLHVENGNCEGLRRGFEKSIWKIDERYREGNLSNTDIRIIMDTFEHFGHISLWLSYSQENKENDSVRTKEIPSPKLNNKLINSNRPRRHSSEHDTERANRKTKEISKKAVRASTRLMARAKGTYHQSENKSNTCESQRRVLRHERLRSKEVTRKVNNSNNSIIKKQHNNQKANSTIKRKRIPRRSIKRSRFSTRKSILRKYLKIRRPFKCTECGKTFKRKYHLKIHQLIHAQKRPHICNQCGKTFTQSSNLKTHLKTHSKIQPYSCKACGRRFSRKGNLQRHRRMHTKEKPFKCKDCGKRFADPGNLNKHQKVHSNERPYLCHQCGKAFKRKHNLDVHLRVHSQEYLYSCKDCGKKFKLSSNMKQHQRIHTNERPNKCGICEKTFTHSRKLQKHLTIHSKERLLSCTTITEKGNLKHNLKVNTNERRDRYETRSFANKQRDNLRSSALIHTKTTKPSD